MTQLEDRQIINLFYERSEQAIEELDRKYGAAVRKTAANILRRTQDVEECTNDTYLGVWNTIPPQNPNSLISYVCRIARNLASVKYCSNTARKRNGQYDLVLDELAECIPSSVNVESELEAKELSAAVNRFLDTLGYEDRFALCGAIGMRIPFRILPNKSTATAAGSPFVFSVLVKDYIAI